MTENSPKSAQKGKQGFTKGVSGNPGGRPKENEMFRERAKKAVDEHVLQAWVDEVVTRGDAWCKCSELLAAYGYGKPASAPEDLSAMAKGVALPAGLTVDQVLAIARGDKP